MMLPKKDQVIYCEGCDNDLFRFKRDVKAGDAPSSELLETLEGQITPKIGDAIYCSHCSRPVSHYSVRWPSEKQFGGERD